MNRFLAMLTVAPMVVAGAAIAQVPPPSLEVLEACATNQIRTLPAPYSDVPTDHWAYEAVAKMYYCGAYRGAVPPEVYQRLVAQNATAQPKSATEPSLDSLQAAPTEVTLANRRYQLEAYVWRDFMPSTSPNTSGLMASVRLTSKDPGVTPPALAIRRLWVIQDEAVWETPVEQLPRSPQDAVEATARGGPTWEPGSAVEVVVQLDLGQGKTAWLRSPNQTIERTF